MYQVAGYLLHSCRTEGTPGPWRGRLPGTRLGHQVTVIDRDPGPADGRWWDRKGVMRFHHPHFPQQVVLITNQFQENFEVP